ncbi:MULTISPECIES: hypothetical protein [unclassified Streptomyces]|uniref:hypothetical protein n=1 Tax=unclassified Streptomyces TaxID=2593676 RepID=UPI002255C468|nr:MULTISPECIES: hypothetical protein [unclassified Streptomyces]MCX4405673.1 hypothetical protein [Streptomyces sp. NBC_01764]MCX5189780.1 hypothetical protein [Streptomyces sp. NBC_00268]
MGHRNATRVEGPDLAQRDTTCEGHGLCRQGIEVISLLHEDIGPIVSWSTDPRTAFNDHPAAWSSLDTPPAIRASRGGQPQSAPATAPAKADTPRPAARR